MNRRPGCLSTLMHITAITKLFYSYLRGELSAMSLWKFSVSLQGYLSDSISLPTRNRCPTHHENNELHDFTYPKDSPEGPQITWFHPKLSTYNIGETPAEFDSCFYQLACGTTGFVTRCVSSRRRTQQRSQVRTCCTWICMFRFINLQQMCSPHPNVQL